MNRPKFKLFRLIISRSVLWLVASALLLFKAGNAYANKPGHAAHRINKVNLTSYWNAKGIFKDNSGKREFGLDCTFMQVYNHKKISTAAYFSLTDYTFNNLYSKQKYFPSHLNFSDSTLKIEIREQQDVWHYSKQNGVDLIEFSSPKKKLLLSLQSQPEGKKNYINRFPFLLKNMAGHISTINYPVILVSGKLELDGEFLEVSGTLWFEKVDNSIEKKRDVLAVDWLSIQLSTLQEELMIFQLYDKNSEKLEFRGAYFYSDSQVVELSHQDIELYELEYWISPVTKSRYPIKWYIKIPKLEVDFIAAAKLPRQENFKKDFTLHQSPVWSGIAGVTGKKAGENVSGISFITIKNRHIARYDENIDY